MEGKSFKQLWIRMLAVEDKIVDQACDALNGMERSQLMQEASYAEAYRLGIQWDKKPPPPLTERWQYLLVREDNSEVRVCISVSIPGAELIERAASHVRVSEPRFVLGSTLAYIGKLQALLVGLGVKDVEEAAKIRTKLRKIKLPAQFQYREE